MEKVYFFPSSAVIYNDKVIPIILELARQGNLVHTIFFDFQAYHNLGISGPYYEWLRVLTQLRKLITKVRWNFWDKVLFVIRYAVLMLEMKWSKGYLAFFDAKGATPLGKRLSRIAKERGTAIMFSSSYLDAWQGYDWEAILRNDAYCKKLKGKSYEVYKKGKEKNVEIYDCDKVLLYNKHLADSEQHLRILSSCVVPQPKLQQWWQTFVRTHPPQFDHEILEKVDKFVAIILTHKGNYFFREDSDLDILIQEIISSVRQIFPETYIVIKPKQTALYQKQWFDEFMNTINDQQVCFSNAPVSILAQKAIVGIMTGNSTAQFEFQIGQAPWIEYCRYSDFWKEVYPKLTYTEEYGGYWAKTPEELSALLQKARNGELKNDLDKFKRRVNFYEQNISFDFFAKETNGE